MSQSKHVATSKTNGLGLTVMLVAGFSIYQGYDLSGIAGIEEADVLLVLTGLGVIFNRLKDKNSRDLHFIKPKLDVL